MHRTLLAAAIAAVAFGVASADAAPRHKHRSRVPHVAAQSYFAPVRAPQVGPAWSGPNQCWTDEGYGRYAPCDGGGKAF
jgi:hypothetical protein